MTPTDTCHERQLVVPCGQEEAAGGRWRGARLALRLLWPGGGCGAGCGLQPRDGPVLQRQQQQPHQLGSCSECGTRRAGSTHGSLVHIVRQASRCVLSCTIQCNTVRASAHMPHATWPPGLRCVLVLVWHAMPHGGFRTSTPGRAAPQTHRPAPRAAAAPGPTAHSPAAEGRAPAGSTGAGQRPAPRPPHQRQQQLMVTSALEWVRRAAARSPAPCAPERGCTRGACAAARAGSEGEGGGKGSQVAARVVSVCEHCSCTDAPQPTCRGNIGDRTLSNARCTPCNTQYSSAPVPIPRLAVRSAYGQLDPLPTALHPFLPTRIVTSTTTPPHPHHVLHLPPHPQTDNNA